MRKFPELFDSKAPANTLSAGQAWLKHLAEPTWSMQSSTRGSGKQSGFVTLLSLRKSLQNLTEPSDFATSRQGDAQSEFEGIAISFSNIY